MCGEKAGVGAARAYSKANSAAAFGAAGIVLSTLLILISAVVYITTVKLYADPFSTGLPGFRCLHVNKIIFLFWGEGKLKAGGDNQKKRYQERYRFENN